MWLIGLICCLVFWHLSKPSSPVLFPPPPSQVLDLHYSIPLQLFHGWSIAEIDLWLIFNGQCHSKSSQVVVKRYLHSTQRMTRPKCKQVWSQWSIMINVKLAKLLGTLLISLEGTLFGISPIFWLAKLVNSVLWFTFPLWLVSVWNHHLIDDLWGQTWVIQKWLFAAMSHGKKPLLNKPGFNLCSQPTMKQL